MTQLWPGETATPEGRARERHRRILLSSAAAAAARLVGTAVAVVAVPLTVSHLGNERYGMWATLASFTALVSFADLGMGNSLVNVIAAAHGRSDRAAARQYVSSALAVLTLVAAVLAALFAVIYTVVPWPSVFNVSSPLAVSEAGPSVAVFAACTLVALPLGVVQRIQMGYQEGFAASAWIALGSVLSLAALVAVVTLDLDLPWVVLALVGAPVVASLLNGIVLFTRRYPWLRPSPSAVSVRAARVVLRTGLLFVTLQLAVAVAYESDNLVIAQILGADQVTQYAIPFRLFTFGGVLLSFVLLPLWPAYGEAIIRNDHAWVRTTLSRSIRFALLINVPLSIVLLLAGRPIIHAWVGGGVTPSFALLAGLALWLILNSISGPLAMFLNGANVIRFQVVCALLMATANLGLSVGLAYAVGLPGPIFGTVIAQVLFILIPSLVYVPRKLAQMSAVAPAG